MKIGLIAMSGIRACNEELLALGLTLPGFVERSQAIASLPSLGLLTLAGMTPQRHQIAYVEVADIQRMPPVPRDFDLIALSSFSAQIYEAYALAQRYAAHGIPVVMGGLHVTMNPHEPARYGASAVLGEGELVWSDVIQDAERGQIKPIYDARGKEFDLAQAPMPAFELLDMYRYNRITVQTSRGCPWRCSFCASSILLTKRYKQKPAHKVLAEIDRIRSLWPRPFIEFADDNSFVNRHYWRALLPELARRRIRWFAETDLAIHEDEALLDMMREAGCVEVLIGFESPTVQGLDGLEHRRNWKHARHAQYRHAIQRIQAAGIRVNACFVVGLDGHDLSVFDALLDFVREARPFDVQITMPTPFPGTSFYAQLKAEGRLLDDRAWHRCTLFDINFKPRGMSIEALEQGFKRLVVALYSVEATRARRQHFRSHCLKRPPRKTAIIAA
jgi:radical SAM superfamily enzyme YgiQ (UPF0313 family)